MFDFNANDTLELLKPFAQWLHEHTFIAGLLTCLISFSESLVIVGYLVPGAIMMPAIGVLIGAGILPATDIILWAILGAILGDGLSYWLGHHYHGAIREMWPIRNFPGLLNRTEIFFAAHGGKSVFIGRFVGAIRPMVPVVAGMLNMPPARFYTANIISAILWAPAFLLPGILLGAVSLEFPPMVATKFLMLLFCGLILAWLMMWLVKWSLVRLQRMAITVLNKSWLFLNRHPTTRPLCKMLRDPSQPYKHGQFSLTLLFLFSVMSFTWLLTLPLTTPDNIPINQAVDYLFKGLRENSVITFFSWFTLLASRKVVIFPILVGCIWLWLKKQRITAIHLLLLYALVYLAVGTIKTLVGGARPPALEAGILSQYGFPSGHSTFVTAIYGFIVLILTRSWPSSWKKKSVYSILCSFVLLSLIARLYLGAHWFTDVVGGLCVGLILLSFMALSYRRYPIQATPTPHLALVMSITLGVTVIVTGNLHSDVAAPYRYQEPLQTLTTQQWWGQASQTPPYYLRNRIGRVTAVIPIQWLGSSDEIHKILLAQGWQDKPQVTWVDLLDRLNPELEQTPLPLLSSQYQYQNPVLEMIKITEDNDSDDTPLQLFHLWPAEIFLTDSKSLLWFGQIEFFIPTHQLLLKRNKKLKAIIPPGLTELKNHLPREQWREFAYQDLPPGLLKRGIHNQVLLITNQPLPKH